MMSLRCLRMAGFVVGFEPVEQTYLRGIETEGLCLFDEPIASLRIIVRSRCFDFIAPAFDFFGRFLFAVLIEPFSHLLVACPFLDLRLEILALPCLTSKDPVIQRTMKMIFVE